MKRPSLGVCGKGSCIIGALLVQGCADVTGWGKLLRDRREQLPSAELLKELQLRQRAKIDLEGS